MVPEESFVSQFMMETSVDGKLFVPYKALDGSVEVCDDSDNNYNISRALALCLL